MTERERLNAHRQLLVLGAAVKPSDWARSLFKAMIGVQRQPSSSWTFGTVAEFLVAKGYGPGGKNAMEELEKFREREKAGE